MSIIDFAVRKVAARQMRRLEKALAQPIAAQEAALQLLLKQARQTRYGQQYGAEAITNYTQYAAHFPLATYETLEPYIQEMRTGARNVLYPGFVRWFAKSSGTTSSKSKYIPVTDDALQRCHYRAGRDILAIFLQQNPASRFYRGKGLTLGGSHKVETSRGMTHDGDLSAILLQRIPQWADWIRTPSRKVALTADFQEKLEGIAREAVHQRVTSLSGVPSWNLVMLKYLLEVTGKETISELWPDLEVFFHGGISFVPYRAQYEAIIPSPKMRYLETYNASEGFFCIQTEPTDSNMQLMVDYGIYYEFIPMSEFGKENPTVVPLEGVRVGVNYAVVITTTSGLYRYVIGDTVQFSSVDPYFLRITGRTKHYINAFGEELIIDNAEQGLRTACEKTGAVVSEYTVAPRFMAQNTQGAHEWYIEFAQLPANLDAFAQILDSALCAVNSDYEAKRTNNVTLAPLVLHALPAGTFVGWMAHRGKLGGQNKVPRLSNDRTYAESLEEFLAHETAQS